MLKIGIVVGSTRPGRNAPDVARWVYDTAQQRGDVQYVMLDLAEFALPLLNEPMSAGLAFTRGVSYTHAHTRRWSAAVAQCDGFVFVAPEYNYGPSAALKNAIDYLYAEWMDKAVTFVGYGMSGGVRCVQQLRQNVAELRLYDMRDAVELSLTLDFQNYTVCRPRSHQAAALNAALDRLLPMCRMLREERRGRRSSASHEGLSA